MTKANDQDQPATYDLIQKFGNWIGKPCSCCRTKQLFRVLYEDDRSFFICGRCDVQSSLANKA